MIFYYFQHLCPYFQSKQGLKYQKIFPTGYHEKVTEDLPQTSTYAYQHSSVKRIQDELRQAVLALLHILIGI